MTNLISIIVPVYNVENYLADCINSILQQTYKHFELILVDDGSSDRSGKICDQMAKADDRLQIFHKENGGLSDARNFGMKHAKGDYITFIDSDDTISSNCIEVLILSALKNNADIVQCQFTLQKEKLNTGTGRIHCYNNDTGLKQILTIGQINVNAWGKLYKKDLFENIEFPYGRINEDSCTIYKTVYKSGKIICIERSLYWHRMREGSIMHTAFSARNLEVLNVANEIRDFLSSQEPIYRNEINYYEYRTALGVLNFLFSSANYEQYKKQSISLKKQILSIDRKNPCLSFKDHCTNALLRTATSFYRVIIRKHKERKSQGVKIR